MYKNKIMLTLLAVSIVAVQTFAFSQKTVDDKSKILLAKTQMNNCVKKAESKEAIHQCLATYNSTKEAKIRVAGLK